ncbi:MAG: hypothetical protein LBT22_05980 [Peptococcaceae bacterium]|nr:hypothetical protein [Peptococcaceae bacterium]
MSWKALGVNLVVGYIVGCVIGIFLPLINWGMALAKFFGFTFQKPKRFHKAVQVFYTFFFALFVSFLMTMFAEVLMGGQSFVVGLQDWGKGFLLYFVDALIVTLVFLDFFEWASRKLQHFPDPPWAAKGGQANHGGGGGGH